MDSWNPISRPSYGLASAMLRSPFFLVAHGTEFSESLPYGFSRDITARAASKVVCISDYTRDMARARPAWSPVNSWSCVTDSTLEKLTRFETGIPGEDSRI